MSTHAIVCSQNPMVLDAVSRAFYPEGSVPTVCESGMELLGAVGVFAPDIVILDLGTPGLGGLLLVSAIKELAPGVPIVAVSTKPDVDARALSQRGVRVASLGTSPDGEAHVLLAELAQLGRGETALRRRGAAMVTERAALGALATIPDANLSGDIASPGFNTKEKP